MRTEETYVGWIKRYIFFHNKRHPKDMGEKEIRAFLTNLAVDRNVAASTQNQAVCKAINTDGFLKSQSLSCRA
jgi:integrase-like protein